MIQAQMTSQLIRAGLQENSLLTVWPLWVEFLWVWGAALGGGFLLRGRWGRSHFVLKLIPFLILGGGVYCVCWGLFVAGVWIPLVPPLLTLGATGLCLGLMKQSHDRHPTNMQQGVVDE